MTSEQRSMSIDERLEKLEHEVEVLVRVRRRAPCCGGADTYHSMRAEHERKAERRRP